MLLRNNSRLFSKCVKYIEGEKMPSICRECKYFRKTYSMYIDSLEFGKCTKVSNLDLVTGCKTYNYASIIREFECKGDWYEENKTTWFYKK
jgi:hypothetical protein